MVPTQVLIAAAAEAFDAGGRPVDPDLGARLHLVGKEVAHFAWLHKCENHLQFVKEWEGAGAGELK